MSAPTYDKLDVTKIAQAWQTGLVINNGILLRNNMQPPIMASSRATYNTHKPRLTMVYHTCAKPVTGVSVSGPTLGVTNTGYTFNSLLSPLDATTPITYRWTATNYTCGAKPNPACPTGASGTFTWTVLGVQTVTLTAKNCSGETFTATHAVTLTTPSPTCPCACDEPDVEWSQHGHHRHKLCVHGDDLQKPHLSSDVHLAGERSLYDDASFVVQPILSSDDMEFSGHQVDHRDGAKLRRRGHRQPRGQHCRPGPIT